MNRRNFFSVALATALTPLAGCVAYVRHGKEEHVLRVPKTTPVGAVITMIKVADDRWIFQGVPPGTTLE
jgi:hypothetical protein